MFWSLFNPLVVLYLAKCQGKGQRLTDIKLLLAVFFLNIVFLLKEFSNIHKGADIFVFLTAKQEKSEDSKDKRTGILEYFFRYLMKDVFQIKDLHIHIFFYR